MGGGGDEVTGGRKDFFVSHAGPDAAWAEWVAWQLVDAGYKVELDRWDWPVGADFIEAMNNALAQCDRIVALFSAAYFDPSRYTQREWTNALVHVAGRQKDRLIPLRVENVPAAQVPPLLQALIYRDLFGITEERAREVVLKAAAGPRRPDHRPVFPGRGTQEALSRRGEPPPRLPVTFPSVWSMPARNPDFAGRDELLKKVRDRLQAGDKAVVQALQGIGGVGKTQIAIEYAHRFARTYDLAWWIPAEPPALIGDQFAALAEELGCSEPGDKAERVQTAVLRELSQRDGWLLVFDNAMDPGALQEWLPIGNGHVLITSRTPNWRGVAMVIGVDVLARAESVTILREWVTGLDRAEADRLAELLGDLPLALAQAAGYMAESGTTAASYRALLETKTGEIMGESPPRNYPGSLAAATRLSADHLAKADPAAAELADLCAFLAPEVIPQDMITSAATELPARLAARAAGPMSWAKTTTQLGRSALARIGQGTIQMHRLTQAILRDRLGPEQAAETRDRTEAILAHSNPGDPYDPDTWPRWAPLMPHLLAADLEGTGSRALRAAASDACWYLLERGDARGGHDLASRVTTRWRERLGVDDPDTLMMASNLAWALEEMGDYPAAERLGRDTLERRRRVLGDDHRSTLVTASNLVAALARLGDYPAAERLGRDTLERRRRVLGDDHPSTLVSASNLAAVLLELGQAQDALNLIKEVLGHRRRVLGEDHPRTLATAVNLGASLRAQGESQAARDLGQDTLTTLRRVLGKDHPKTLNAAVELAVTLRLQGDERSYRELATDTLERVHRVLGDDHPETRAATRKLPSGRNEAEDRP